MNEGPGQAKFITLVCSSGGSVFVASRLMLVSLMRLGFQSFLASRCCVSTQYRALSKVSRNSSADFPTTFEEPYWTLDPFLIIS